MPKPSGEGSLRNILIAIAALSLIVSVVAVVVAVLAYQKYLVPITLSVSQAVPSGNNAVYIDSAVNPIGLTLANDMRPYVGKVYRIWSLTAQAHTVSITTGQSVSTFTGGTRIATFGGAIGDGFVFEVISANHAVVISSTNVVFS